jgi:hypothetical protein
MNRYPVLSGIASALLIAVLFYFYMVTHEQPQQKSTRIASTNSTLDPGNFSNIETQDHQSTLTSTAIDEPTTEPTPVPSAIDIDSASTFTLVVSLDNVIKGTLDEDLPGKLSLQTEDASQFYTGIRDATTSFYAVSSIPSGKYKLLSQKNELFIHSKLEHKINTDHYPVITVVNENQEEHIFRIPLTPVRVKNTEFIENAVMTSVWAGREMLKNDVLNEFISAEYEFIPAEYKYHSYLPLSEWTDPENIYYFIPGSSHFSMYLKKDVKLERLALHDEEVTVPVQNDIFEIDLDFQSGGTVRGIIDSPLYDGFSANLYRSDVDLNAPKVILAEFLTDVHGSEFIMEHIKAGDYFVKLINGHNIKGPQSQVFSVKKGEETVVRIKTEEGETSLFTCIVTEHNGLPIRNTSFSLNQENYLTQGVSDDNGLLLIPYRKSISAKGTLLIRVKDGNIHPMEGGAIPVSLNDTEKPTLQFDQLARQTVYIVDEEKKPVESAQLTIEQNTANFARSSVNFTCPEGGGGKYEFEAVPIGESTFYLTTFKKIYVDSANPQDQDNKPVYLNSVTNNRIVLATQKIFGDEDIYLQFYNSKTISFTFVDSQQHPIQSVRLFQIPNTYGRWNGNAFHFWLKDTERLSELNELSGKESHSKEDGTVAFPVQSSMFPIVAFYHDTYGLGFIHVDTQQEKERKIVLRPATKITMPPLKDKGFRYLATMMDDGSKGAISFVWSYPTLNESPISLQPGIWKMASFQTDLEYEIVMSKYPSMINQIEWKQWDLSPNEKVEFPIKIILHPDSPFLRKQQ